MERSAEYWSRQETATDSPWTESEEGQGKDNAAMIHHIVWGDAESDGGSSPDSKGTAIGQARPFRIDMSQPGSSNGSAQSTPRFPDADGAARSEDACESEAEEQPVHSTLAELEIADLFSDDGDMPGEQQDSVPGIPLNELLSEAELQELMAIVPLDENGSLTSLGSLQHDANFCRNACLFVHSFLGCKDGILCGFCHFTHKRKNRVRLCKGKRGRFRVIRDRRQADFQRDNEAGQAQPGIIPTLPLEDGVDVEKLRARVFARLRWHKRFAGQNRGVWTSGSAAGNGGSSSSSSSAVHGRR